MLKSERGVTLVEIIFAMAITALLASSILFGRDQVKVRQEFTQAVDQLVETIANARNQATTGVGCQSTNGTCNSGQFGGTDQSQVIYAKVIEMSGSPLALRISTETVNADDITGGPSAETVIVNDHLDPYTVVMPDGITLAGGGHFNLLFGLAGRLDN